MSCTLSMLPPDAQKLHIVGAVLWTSWSRGSSPLASHHDLLRARSRLTPGASQMAPVNLWNISGSPREGRVRMIVIRRELAHLGTGNRFSKRATSHVVHK